VKNGYPKISLLKAHNELLLYPIEKSFLEAHLWHGGCFKYVTVMLPSIKKAIDSKL